MLRDEYAIEMELLRRKAQNSLMDFIYYTRPNYMAWWHHEYISETIENFLGSSTLNKLMLFVPPQHGKSAISSTAFPAFAIGKDPSRKIVISSYSADLAETFNSDTQKIISSEAFTKLFPHIKMDKSTAHQCTFHGFDGNIKAVGVTGGLTGNAVDLAIIDDPVKDAIEASSTTYRERVWQWYLNVLETRLHNKSKVLLIMTRWHEDDLAGRLLQYQPDKWHVISIPAIREDMSDPNDPRQIGEALWPVRHSLEKLNDLRAMSETTFASLYQQRPAPAEGNKVKREWWQYVHEKEVPGGIVWDLWLDGAYTKSSENDPTGLMVCGFLNNTLFVKHATDKHMEMPELLKFVEEYAEIQGLANRSTVYLEPKASGKSLRQMLVKSTNLDAVEISNHLINEGKEARIQVAAPKIESGRIVLIRGAWNDRFTNQICTFPNAVHDEYVDLIGYAAYHYFDKNRKRGIYVNDFSEYR